MSHKKLFIRSAVGITPTVLPVYTIDNISVSVANKVGNIYWILKNTPFVITADLVDTDASNIIPTNGDISKLIIMAERLIDDEPAGDDIRVIAEIAAVSGHLKLTLNMNFEISGNYLIDEDRMNRGLERINKNYRIAMVPSKIEFDVHI